jgi:hypothetical protein
VVAWEELEAKLFSEEPGDRSDADIDAYLKGASGQPEPVGAQRAQLVATFKNAPSAPKSAQAQREFDECQVAIQSDMAAWFDKWEAEHRGVKPDCEMAKASAAAARECAKYDLTRNVLGEERQCACERSAVWKTLVVAAGIQELEGKASAAVAKGVELKCP